MKKLLVAALFVGVPLVGLVGCTQEHIVRRQAPPAETPAEAEPDPAEEEGTKPTDPGTKPPGETPSNPVTPSTKPEDTCLDGQDLDAADINISSCPAVPEIPGDVAYAKKDKFGTAYDLGAWEIGTTKTGATYKYGTLSAPSGATPRKLSYDGGEVEVNALNLECWAKGYYRLRKILQNPPVEWIALRNAGFQYRFFQFQTDLRNGPTGYKGLASFQDHLVKWVTVISAAGDCQQPTLSKFKAYATAELKTRGIAVPPAN